eukprot:8690865-Alexandrium_andersonii.AAC.1
MSGLHRYVEAGPRAGSPRQPALRSTARLVGVHLDRLGGDGRVLLPVACLRDVLRLRRGTQPRWLVQALALGGALCCLTVPHAVNRT